MEKAAVLAYDGLAAGGQARTLVIANFSGWNAPLRNIGYYWDGDPTIRPEGWYPVAWRSGADGNSIKIQFGTVAEPAAVIVQFS